MEKELMFTLELLNGGSMDILACDIIEMLPLPVLPTSIIVHAQLRDKYNKVYTDTNIYCIGIKQKQIKKLIMHFGFIAELGKYTCTWKGETHYFTEKEECVNFAHDNGCRPIYCGQYWD